MYGIPHGRVSWKITQCCRNGSMWCSDKLFYATKISSSKSGERAKNNISYVILVKKEKIIERMRLNLIIITVLYY